MNTMTSNLRQTDLAWCVNKLPKAVREQMKKMPARLFLAGGYIRSRITGEKPHDIDLFVPDKDSARLLAEALAVTGKPPMLNVLKVIETDNAFTVPTPISIQVIHRWTYNRPEDLVQSFDFTIAQAAIWYAGNGVDKWRSLCHNDFYADLAGRRLVYTHPQRNEDAGGSALRLLKFYQRGFRAPLTSYAGVMSRLLKAVDIHKLPDMDEATLTQTLAGLLREVDPAVDPEHIAH